MAGWGGGGGGLTGPLTVSAVWLLEAFTPLSLFSMASIVADEDVFLQFKDESKKQYSRIWSQFRDFVPEHDFELAPPAEDSFTLFFNFLRHQLLPRLRRVNMSSGSLILPVCQVPPPLHVHGVGEGEVCSQLGA